MSTVPTASLLMRELEFTTSRSSGPGGQNVNKVNTRVTLRFDVVHSDLLSADQKEIIAKKLAAKISTEGMFMISSQETRSQLHNKELVIASFDQLLTKAFTVKKKRKPTKPSKSAVESRIKGKKQASEKKKWRQKPL